MKVNDIVICKKTFETPYYDKYIGKKEYKIVWVDYQLNRCCITNTNFNGANFTLPYSIFKIKKIKLHHSLWRGRFRFKW